MTKAEIERIEVLVKEMRSLLPKCSNIGFGQDDGDYCHIGLLEKDMPPVDTIEYREIGGKTYFQARIGSVTLGGIKGC